MKILVLNCGSSSVKYKLIDSASKEVLAEGGVEKIGLPDSFLKFKRPDGSKETITVEMPDAKAAVENVIKVLTDPKECKHAHSCTEAHIADHHFFSVKPRLGKQRK